MHCGIVVIGAWGEIKSVLTKVEGLHATLCDKSLGVGELARDVEPPEAPDFHTFQALPNTCYRLHTSFVSTAEARYAG